MVSGGSLKPAVASAGGATTASTKTVGAAKSSGTQAGQEPLRAGMTPTGAQATPGVGGTTLPTPDR
jgi:hypothetical protein